jgi:hypothetical protein
VRLIEYVAKVGAVGLLAVLLAVAPARAAVPAHGRTWELVTNVPTDGVNQIGVRAVSADGDRVVDSTFGPLSGSPSGDLFAQELATRTADGWSPQPVGEPFELAQPELTPSGPLAIDTAMSSWLWGSDQPLLPGAPPAGQEGLYLRRPDGALTLLGAAGDAGAFSFVAADDAVRHAVFQSTAHLLPADAGRTSGPDAYELADDRLRLVGADSSGAAISSCGSVVGDGLPAASALLHPVSQDGTQIVFSARPGDCGGPQRVYVREDGSRTVEASASHCARADCDAPQDVAFACAARDGSSVFLITGQQLTSDDVDESPDLYRYDVAGGTLTRLSAGPPGVTADVGGTIARCSDDGSRVYFLASGQLVPGQGLPGDAGVYLSDHGRLRHVSSATGVDLREVQITPDGGVLAITTVGQLLPSDTDTALDVYRYDAATGALTQVTPGNGPSGATFAAARLAGSLQPSGTRWMDDAGDRVLFVTAEPLVPEDAGETPDVYEWFGGDVGLVSSGHGDRSLTFGGVSADGRSVFFTTDETLASADRNDGDQDLYVARLGGGFPDRSPAPACEGAACRAPPSGRLVRAQPDTFAYVEPVARPFRVRPPGRRARAALATAAGATIVVDVPAAGRVTLVARAHRGRRTVAVARAVATARAAGSLSLRLRLSAGALRSLRAHRRLRLGLVLRETRQAAAPALDVTLRSGA